MDAGVLLAADGAEHVTRATDLAAHLGFADGAPPLEEVDELATGAAMQIPEPGYLSLGRWKASQEFVRAVVHFGHRSQVHGVGRGDVNQLTRHVGVRRLRRRAERGPATAGMVQCQPPDHTEEPTLRAARRPPSGHLGTQPQESMLCEVFTGGGVPAKLGGGAQSRQMRSR